MNASTFKIYDASAGSGKTFTLVKEYLKLLFKAKNKDHFKHILAITFTNKAAGEMKERIIETLMQFDDVSIIDRPNSMSKAICEELEIQPNMLHQKAKSILQTIIHNYGAFDISTIDGFTHRVIRTFAQDLKLPINFEVELDTDSLLKEAVDAVIAEAGNDKKLTQTLVDFAIEKADDDKSWDISNDLLKASKLLTKESELPYLKTLEAKTLDDFKTLKKNLNQKIAQTEKTIITIASQTLTLIEESGLEYTDFTRSTLPNHFVKASKLNFERLYDNKLQENIENRKGIYTTKLDAQLKDTIEAILPEIEYNYKQQKQQVYHLKFLKAFLKNITPLSVLNTVNKALKEIKEEKNKLLISEFNTLISDEIKDQPTPFIYERLGEKFRHYFIDEFQDTSKMQWQNLVPLIDNALSGENGSAMLVGDAKQAIYRWRGGEAEQFINLYNKTENPFQIEQEIHQLETNYRSSKSVINFNNSFFKYVSQTAFADEKHSELFNKAFQHTFNDNEGYVNLSFLEIEKEDDTDLIYAEKVLETINSCKAKGYNLSDICVLVRKKKHGFALAQFLSEQGVAIISSETLLIKRSSEVQFVTNVLYLLLKPENLEVKAKVLNFLANHFKIDNKHQFLEENLQIPVSELFSAFENFNIKISYKELIQLSIFDLVESVIRNFNLVEKSDAYIQFYLDFVLDYSQKNRADISGFLEHYENKKDNLSIVSPEGQEAVKIMTIHKSKGLQFPVVILPYADLDMYREIEPKEWLTVSPEEFSGFTHTLLNYNKDFEEFSEESNQIYHSHQSKLELDNLNILYVALTRPESQLYIISKKEIDKKGEANAKKYSGLLINYLKEQQLWSDNKLEYIFGQNELHETQKSLEIITEEQRFISNDLKTHDIKIVTKSALLWDTKQAQAIEKGNLIHKLLSLVKTENDIDFAINDFIKSGTINLEQAKELKQTLHKIVNHEKLKMYFTSENIIYNEREIISKEGTFHIPDRLVINPSNEAVIIDYKTGEAHSKYIQQLNSYQQIIEEMNFSVIKKILVFINDTITIKEF